MLIRSQDGNELLNFERCNYIYLGNNGEKDCMWILADVGRREFVMGCYADVARCREILDDIQTAYNYLEGAYNAAPKNLDGAIYQMPEE